MYKTRERKGYERGTAQNFLHSFPLPSTPVVQSYWAWTCHPSVSVLRGNLLAKTDRYTHTHTPIGYTVPLSCWGAAGYRCYTTTPNPQFGWSRMSGRRTSGTCMPSLGLSSLPSFRSFPRENRSSKNVWDNTPIKALSHSKGFAREGASHIFFDVVWVGGIALKGGGCRSTGHIV